MSRFYILMILMIVGLVSTTKIYGIGKMSENKSKNYLINQDRVWHYRVTQVREGGYVEFEMRFGKDTVVDDETYTILSTPRQTYYHEINGHYERKELGPAKTFMLLRENDKKVYVHRGVDPEMDWPYKEKECILYDFGAEVGDSYASVSMRYMPLNVKILSYDKWRDNNGEILVLQKVEYAFKDYTEYTTEPGYYLQGIGPTHSHATILGFFTLCPPTWEPLSDDYPWNYGTNSHLIKVTDINGNILFTPDLFTNIHEIGTNQDKDWITYSLQGIPVTNPQPGQIYIRNGKKFIMPRE